MNSMTHVLLLCGLLAPLGAAQNRAVPDPGEGAARSRAVRFNGGLEAELLSVGRSKDHRAVTIHCRIRNLGKSTAELLLIRSSVVATDNTGGAFADLNEVSGIAICNNGGAVPSMCLGFPEKNNSLLVALQGFTQIDPDTEPGGGITMNMRLFGGGEGPLVSFSANVFFRFIADPVKDAALADADRYRQFRIMSLSFPPMPVTDAK